MRSLMRVVRFAWPYRARFLLSVLCGAFVAVLWAVNLSTVYPVVSVLYSEQNLQGWIKGRLAASEQRLQTLTQQIPVPGIRSTERPRR